MATKRPKSAGAAALSLVATLALAVSCKGVLGIEDWTPESTPDGGAASGGDAGSSGAGGSGGASGDGSGGTAGDAGDGSAIAVANAPCTEAGAGACVGHASDLPLLCDGAKWTVVAKCATGMLCDTTPGADAGSCKAVVAECAGKDPGNAVCQGMTRAICGVDLLTVSALDTCAVDKTICANGACEACPGVMLNCDSVATDCEVDPNTAATCGASCASLVECTTKNGTPSCSGGVCGVGSCNPGYADCDTNASTGCETYLDDSTACGTTCNGRVACAAPTGCVDGACVLPASCAGLPTDCGAAADESCCTSLPVEGGDFFRSYDGVTSSSKAAPATLSDFRLDKFEVTVGRFRAWKAAWDGGWRPSSGAGKHAHLNGGKGLTNSAGNTEYEGGWDDAWTSFINPLDVYLLCDGYATWTSSPGANETLPISCANWYELHAFCIWDGAALPTEAGWNYTASGGDEHRIWPWGYQVPDATLAVSNCTYNGSGPGTCTGVTNIAPVGSRPAGNGRWGHGNLGGSVWEWTLDWLVTPYVAACIDCSYLPASATARVGRGGRYSSDQNSLANVTRSSYDPVVHYSGIGVRCVRGP